MNSWKKKKSLRLKWWIYKRGEKSGGGEEGLQIQTRGDTTCWFMPAVDHVIKELPSHYKPLHFEDTHPWIRPVQMKTTYRLRWCDSCYYRLLVCDMTTSYQNFFFSPKITTLISDSILFFCFFFVFFNPKLVFNVMILSFVLFCFFLQNDKSSTASYS